MKHKLPRASQDYPHQWVIRYDLRVRANLANILAGRHEEISGGNTLLIPRVLLQSVRYEQP
jgi:hypothetical protein